MPAPVPALAYMSAVISAFILVSNFARPAFDAVRVHAQTAGAQ